MATTRPFAYNPGSAIPGTEQVGSIAYGLPTAGFVSTGLEWWNGPDEDLGYVIAHPVPSDTQPTQIPGVFASVGFFRSDALTEGSFIDLADLIAGPSGGGPFGSGATAKTWLNNNGYWTSFEGSTGATGATGSLFITITQNGSNVVLQGSGSLNIDDLTFATSGILGGGGLGPQSATFISGTNGGQFAQYNGSITAPANFGTGGGASSSSSTGSVFGVIINMVPPYQLIVPSGYTSGDPISGTMTFNSQTIAGLGLTEGTYNWTWGSGPNADGITMVIGGTGSTGSTGGTGAGGTGYGFNLVALPYTFPSAGNSIMNESDGGATSGSNNPNLLATPSRGFYFSNIDNTSTDRSSYYSTFLGQNVTITLSQDGNSAVYTGNTGAFKEWTSAGTTGYVFGTGIGVPPSGTPSGTATLVQASPSQFSFGSPVYVTLSLT